MLTVLIAMLSLKDYVLAWAAVYLPMTVGFQMILMIQEIEMQRFSIIDVGKREMNSL